MDIQTKHIERITITCSDAKRGLALDHVYNNGYKVLVSGPMPTGCLTVDHSQFQVIAEKEIAK